MFVQTPPKLVYSSSSSNGGSSLAYPFNAHVRKTRSLASAPHHRYYMPAYPIYYVPQALPLRSSVLNESDSSDDDIPLAKIRSKENTKTSKKRGKHKEKQIRRIDKEGVIDDSFIMSRDTLEGNSDITLFDSNLGQVDDQKTKSNEDKTKGRFSYLRKFFSYGNHFAVENR